jgi:hypothetical protein
MVSAALRSERTWQGKSSSMGISRPKPGILLVVVTGMDIGEHGEAPFAELTKDIDSEPVQLFVDARHSQGVTLDVSGRWARWLANHRDSLQSVHMLTGSRFVQLTASFVRDYASLGERMCIYTAPEEFEQALSRCGSGTSEPPPAEADGRA